MSSNKIKSFNQNRDLCFWSMIWGWIPSVWRAVLSLFYPPVIIWGKNGKNSENPVGSNKIEKRKPKSAVYRRILASVVYFHLRIISAKNHKRKMTRNQLTGQTVRGFESLHLRQSLQWWFHCRFLFMPAVSLFRGGWTSRSWRLPKPPVPSSRDVHRCLPWWRRYCAPARFGSASWRYRCWEAGWRRCALTV